jgi:thiol-disulfide isomerase/thioredoxin
MLRVTLLVFFVGGLFAGCESGSTPPLNDTVTSVPPTFQSAVVQTCDGAETDLLDIVSSHDVTYITFGANWCTACKEEVATLNSNIVANFDMNAVGVVQVLIEDDPGMPPTLDVCTGWQEAFGHQFSLLSDSNQVTLPQYFADGIATLPMHLLVTKDGVIRYTALGPMTDDLAKLIQDWLP